MGNGPSDPLKRDFFEGKRTLGSSGQCTVLRATSRVDQKSYVLKQFKLEDKLPAQIKEAK